MSSLLNYTVAMTLFSGVTDAYSHQVRFLLSEKSLVVDIVDVDWNENPEDLVDLNPYNTLPTLLDRELVLYEPDIIMEYLDERFPYPPLMPGYPTERAKTRLLLHRMYKDWYSLYDIICSTNHLADQVSAQRAQQELMASLLSVSSMFEKYPFFMGAHFSILDCALAPLLWRLPSLKIKLPKSAEAIYNYANKIFAREGFQDSLTSAERALRTDRGIFVI
jgi:RNA polymerase-associated protein